MNVTRRTFLGTCAASVAVFLDLLNAKPEPPKPKAVALLDNHSLDAFRYGYRIEEGDLLAFDSNGNLCKAVPNTGPAIGVADGRGGYYRSGIVRFSGTYTFKPHNLTPHR